MTTRRVPHLARLLQELNKNFLDANAHLSQAWGAHEMMRDALMHFSIAHKEMLEKIEEEKRREG